jgi:hypothetical protein
MGLVHAGMAAVPEKRVGLHWTDGSTFARPASTGETRHDCLEGCKPRLERLGETG